MVSMKRECGKIEGRAWGSYKEKRGVGRSKMMKVVK